MLLSHWLEHNRDHGREYGKWAEVARRSGLATTAECLERAVELLAKADQAFEKALASLGGPVKEHHHNSHHHHHD